MTSAERLQACSEALKQLDYDRYLASLYAAPQDRLGLVALHSFNAELGRVRESVSEPMLGEIRLTWWREAIEGLEVGQIRAHPVVQALAGPVKAGHISTKALIDMVEARLSDLYEDAPASEDVLKRYAGQTGGAIMAQAMAITGADATHIDVARGIGSAVALGGIVRSVAFHASMRRVHLPAQELRALGVDEEQIFQGEFTPEIAALCARLGKAALADLNAGLRSNFSKRQRKALIPAVFSQLDLIQASAQQFDPQAVYAAAPRPRKMLKAWLYSLTGRA